VTVLRPVTGSVEGITGARPVTSLVAVLDQTVGCLPVLGTVLGDDTLGSVTGPVTGAVDDVLGSVGGTVGTIPGTVDGLPPVLGGGLPPVLGGVLPGGTDPVVEVPGGSVVPGSTAPAGSATSTARPGGAVGVVDASGTRPAAPLAAAASEGVTAASGAVTVLGAATDRQGRSSAQDATLGGRALLVPGGHGQGGDSPLDGPVAGVLGSSASGSAGPAAAVATVGSAGDHISLAAGSRGTLSDDAVPASVVGEHDVAPD
jgi:hypothetical protein